MNSGVARGLWGKSPLPELRTKKNQEDKNKRTDEKEEENSKVLISWGRIF